MNLEGDPGGGEPSLLFFGMVVETYVRRCQQNRESTRIYANRSPIHPRLAPLKSRGAGGLLGRIFLTNYS